MAGYVQAQDQVQAIVAHIKTLTVEKLKALLRTEGLPLSGVKSELQIRAIAHVEKLRNAGDQAGLNRVRGIVRGLPPAYSNTYPSPYSNHTPNSSASPQFASPKPHAPPYAMSPNSPYAPSRITFKNSPFYTIIKPLTQTLECKARETTRDTARLTVSLTQALAEQLATDPTCRVMVFCAAEGFPTFTREYDIAFPHNVELKCNSEEVKANLRGLKNKPGSTRPADITHLIKKHAAYPNVVEMVYALTSKGKSQQQKYFLVVNLVSKKPIDTMVSEIRHGKTISKEQILRDMRTKAEDPDIVATSSVLSLKDPVAYTRIVTPCRSIACNHNQCFDAASYLQLQEQAPTWTCPICNKPAPWENLALDLYVNDILNSTPQDIDAVAVEPDGRWHIQKDNDEPNHNGNPTPSEEDDDEDLVVMPGRTEHRPLKVEALTPHSVRTPPLSSREDSTAPSASRQNKRPRADVIDLTLSDDDEQPPPKQSRPSDTLSGASASRPRPATERYGFQMPSHSSSPTLTRFNPSL
ncbi:E3 SUMO-protein ligase pli1 [Exophiala dermatitidis]